jgi:hypothetical protein
MAQRLSAALGRRLVQRGTRIVLVVQMILQPIRLLIVIKNESKSTSMTFYGAVSRNHGTRNHGTVPRLRTAFWLLLRGLQASIRQDHQLAHLRGTNDAFLTPEEQQAFKIVQEQRALAVGVGSTGGFAVPFVLDQTLLPQASTGSKNPFRQLCRVESISGSNEWRSATSGAMVAANAAEGAVTSDNSPTLGQKTLTTDRVQAFAPVSLELAEDWTDLLDQVGALILSARDDLEAVQFVSGTGAPPAPEGLLV